MYINLPGIGGIEAMCILREDPSNAHIAVIARSASAMLRDIEKGLQAGFVRHIARPICIDEFMKTLDIPLRFAQQAELRFP